MTRTPPIYTVRWSSQISRLNNRLGPPTPVPNAVSSASSTSINIFKHFHSNFYRKNTHHCFSSTNYNNNNNDNNNKTIPTTNTYNNNDKNSFSDSYVINIENCNQYKSLTDRLEDAKANTDVHTITVFTLISNNKLSCLFIALWMYNFIAGEIFIESPRFGYN